MKIINPYSEEESDVEEDRDPEALFQRAYEQYRGWRNLSVIDRLQALQPAYNRLALRAEELAIEIAQEMGKPILLARAEVERALEEWRYMLDNAPNFLEPERVDAAQIHFSPLGVVAVISPWNFPLMLPLRAIIPALLAGNSVLFKPSELSPRVGIRIAELLSKAIPLVLAVGGKELGATIVKLPVAAIAFTGSTAVGKSIAREAVSSMKRTLLELGGLDAAIVLADADLPSAVQEIVRSNARNSGQVCNAVKRALVHESIVADFIIQARAVAQSLSYGDPLSPHTDVGPLVSASQRDRVRGFLDDALQKGATPYSVAIAPKRGFFFPQTLLTDVPRDARLLQEEPFGPLLPIIPFTSDEEALEIANNTRFGLTASVWTHDTAKAELLAQNLDVGMVRQNSHSAMPSGIPWGGCKESGIGRMKTKEGLREFTNVKVLTTTLS